MKVQSPALNKMLDVMKRFSEAQIIGFLKEADSGVSGNLVCVSLLTHRMIHCITDVENHRAHHHRTERRIA